MRVQISNTATQNVKSNTKRLSFLNIEDIEFQMSVLKLGMDFHEKTMFASRSNKEYSFHYRKYDLYGSIHGALQMTKKDLEVDNLYKSLFHEKVKINR